MQMSHHQQQVPQASGQRKKVTIKDPHTMRDVTNDILNRNSGKRSDMDAGISQSPSTSSMVGRESENICFQNSEDVVVGVASSSIFSDDYAFVIIDLPRIHLFLMFFCSRTTF